MSNEEKELLLRVLPDEWTFEALDGTRPRYLVCDEEGDVFLQGVSNTAKGAVLELIEQARRNGVNEGRMNKQHEILTVLGVNQVIADLRKK